MSPEPLVHATQLLGPSSGRMLPSLELAFPDGRAAPLWDYRGRGPLIVFLHEAPTCTACSAQLAALAAAHSGYREMTAQVLAVGDTAVPALPYPVLVDPEQRLARVLCLPLPAMLVVGRTGEIWAGWGGDHAALPDTRELNGWLDYSLSECRECFCCELAWPQEWVRGESGAP